MCAKSHSIWKNNLLAFKKLTFFMSCVKASVFVNYSVAYPSWSEMFYLGSRIRIRTFFYPRSYKKTNEKNNDFFLLIMVSRCKFKSLKMSEQLRKGLWRKWRIKCAGSGIRDPEKLIPDPGGKKAPFHGSRIRIRNTGIQILYLKSYLTSTFLVLNIF
jgi:hypothetical protein